MSLIITSTSTSCDTAQSRPSSAGVNPTGTRRSTYDGQRPQLDHGALLSDHERFDRLRFWMVGGLGAGYDALAAVGSVMLVGVALGLFGVRLLDTLALGDDLARSLGRNVIRDRILVGLAVVLLAGSATAAAGPIAFGGLIVPHAVRAMTGSSHGRVLPLSLG